jgi:hypothetical protein
MIGMMRVETSVPALHGYISERGVTGAVNLGYVNDPCTASPESYDLWSNFFCTLREFRQHTSSIYTRLHSSLLE